MVEQIREDIEAFYDYVQPSSVEILWKDSEGGHSNEYFIKSKEEFVKIVEDENKKSNCYAPHRKIRGHRCEENVIELRRFTIDIDDDKDGKKVKAFEEYCEKWNIKIGAKVESGGGYHCYIPYETTTIGPENKEEMKSISLIFRQHLLQNSVEVDTKVFDLARLIRIWGTWNFNKNALCKKIYANQLSKEDVTMNTMIIRSLKNYVMSEEHLGEKAISDFVEYSPFMNYISKNKLTKENTYKNDILIKNVAAYYWATKGEDGYLFGKETAILQGKSENEFRGWWKKAKDGFQYNVGEIYNWVKEYYPELLKYCVHKGNIIYYEGSESFGELKSRMREEKKLIISKAKMYNGKIEPSQYSNKQEITVMQEWEIMKGKELVDAGIHFLDESPLLKNIKVTKEITVNFYMYEFSDDKGNSYLLFSEKKLDNGSSSVIGNEIKLPDDVLIGNYGKIKSRRKAIFCFEAESYIRKYNSIDEIYNTFNFSKEQLIDFLLYHAHENKTYKEPGYINTLLLAFLFSAKNPYQLHLMINGPPHCGKTSVLEAINDKFDEENLSSGSGGTIKGLVPSFGQATPKIGLLCSANRLCFVDEFFRLVHAEKIRKDDQDSDNLAKMNELLEYRTRKCVSGKGQIDALMKAKLFGVTNPIEGTKFTETIRIIPETVVERILIVNIGKKMAEWVNGNVENYKEGRNKINIDKFVWLGIYDFFNSFRSEGIDFKKIMEIVKRCEQKVPEEMREAYNKRYKHHHIQCLMDGIIKTRCLFEKNKHFVAKDEDYETLERLWDTIVVLWDEDNDKLTNEQDAILNMFIEEKVRNVDIIKEECNKRNIDFAYNILILEKKGLIEISECNIKRLFIKEEISVIDKKQSKIGDVDWEK